MRLFRKRPQRIGNVYRDPITHITATSGVSGILASLWRSIQFKEGITGTKFENMLTDFIVKAKRVNGGEHPISKHFTRGNLRRELEKDKMTIKVFVKALRILRVRNITFIVELTHSDGRQSLHSTKVDLGSPDMKAEFARDVNNESDNEE